MDPFAVHIQARITASAARRLRRGHLWIYAGEWEDEPADAEAAIVRVVDPSRNVLGYAFYSRRSQIRLRLFSRDAQPPTPEFFRSRVIRSINRRRALINPASACRLIFGEGDLLPGIIVDRYGDYLVLQTLSSSTDALKSLLVDILKEAAEPKGILERNDVKVRQLEGLEEVRGVLWGDVPEEVEIVEDGIRFLVDLQRGQKTGFFLDQSRNRIAARDYACGAALDCFTNTGAFALHFAPRCESVIAVDISADSLAVARRNCALNGFGNVDFVEGNVFDFLRELENEGQKFDIVCLDPPAFAKNRKALAGARSGYKEINLRALKLLKPEGILVTSSCSYHMPETDFYDLIGEAARDCHRFIQVLERRGQSVDHPVLAGMPETHYLKCFILRAL
ncbi:MAG: class I SAM-dependent rRNA methyltransferase [Acidobacteria bacterium]|nr:class I SAM-dependent rRNA methyltransferase [Acidobacteriota bacterium]